MSEDIFDKLKAFIVEQAAVYETEVTRSAQIEDDLGVTGDDAEELLIAYGKEFNVDVTKFMAADYFRGEGGIQIPLFLKRLLGIKRARKILTVGHLEKGIIAGRLDEEVINS